MKSVGRAHGIYLQLLAALLDDLTATYPSLAREFSLDLAVLQRRFESEGLPFFTKTLPLFGKAIDASFQTGVFVCPSNFHKKSKSALPRLFYGLTSQVYNVETGALMEADPILIKDLRQVCFMLYKLQTPYTAEQEERVLASFTAEQVREDPHIGWHESLLLHNASVLIAEVLKGLDPLNIEPKHGPGAVATREKGHEKWEFKRVYMDMEQLYPFRSYFHVSKNHLLDCSLATRDIEIEEYGFTRVLLVFKDSRGPRLISAEPCEKQYIQQGQMRLLVTTLEKHPLSRNRVNFTDQSINQGLALQASLTGRDATLDMTSASDTVKTWHIERTFPPKWVQALTASRSSFAVLPSGDVVPLSTFAPMGSAVCFPVEALVFWSVASAAIALKDGTSIRKSCRSVYVYGDDIIIPTRHAGLVTDALLRLGFIPSPGKCFTQGPFRESCGMDAYKGVNVAPIKVKTPWSTSKRSKFEAFQAYVDYSNLFYKHGYWRTSSFLRGLLDRTFGSLPYTPSGSYSYPSYVSYTIQSPQGRRKRRWNAHLHRFEWKVKVVRSRSTPNPLQGWRAVLASLLGGFGPTVAPQPGSVKTRWMPILP